MNRLYFFILFVGCGWFHSAAQTTRLWYRQPAKEWTDALPIGNGRLGAMVYGGIKDDRIQFNEETLWTGSPRSYSRPGAWRYLDSIRNLLIAGKQKEAEALAENQFMGLKSAAGDVERWYSQMIAKGDALAASNLNDKSWGSMYQPSYDGWEVRGFDGLDGNVWLRRTFVIDDPSKAKEWILDLNRIRDNDRTFINGKLVGNTRGTDPRRYKISSADLKKGLNIIAVQVLNVADKGGITGYKDTTRKIGIYPAGSPQSLVVLNGLWKYQVVDRNPPDIPHYEADYQPFGDLVLHMQHGSNAKNYTRELLLDKDMAFTQYKVDGITYKRGYLVSAPDNVMVCVVKSSESKALNFSIELSSPHQGYTLQRLTNGNLLMKLKVKHGALSGAAELSLSMKDGQTAFRNGQLFIAGATEATIKLAAATNFKDYQTVEGDPSLKTSATIARVQSKSSDEIYQDNLKDYQKYFNAFSIKLGVPNDSIPTDERLKRFATTDDQDFVALYTQYGRYLLINSSRPGTQPANLQGIWNDKMTPPWGSKYTTNINLEMNYWPVEVLNVSDMAMPLFSMINDLQKTGAKTARDHYNARGWVLHHNTDLWRGTAPINASNHGIWVTGAAWLCESLWEHYQFNPSRKFLSDTAWPAMKGAAMFFKDVLVKDPKTGWYISTPSNSPEHGGLVAGPTMDHQIIRSLFRNVVQASVILDRDKAFADSIQAMIPLIAPNKIGKYGQLQEWMEDKDDPNDHHRHVSHLWGVHPGKEINWLETPELLKAAQTSLEQRGDEATGWSLAWKINLWARFRQGDHALQLIKMLLRPTQGDAGSYNNLFDAHPPFQIDGNFGAPAGIAEMLIQTHTGSLEIFPALPSGWREGSIRGMKARGGLLLDFDWKEGSLDHIKIYSSITQTIKLKYGLIYRDLPIKAGQGLTLNGSLQ